MLSKVLELGDRQRDENEQGRRRQARRQDDRSSTAARSQKRWMPRSMGRANRINAPHVARHGRRRRTEEGQRTATMGQKTHPIGFRLGVIETWSSQVVRGEELREVAARGPEAQEVRQEEAQPRGRRRRRDRARRQQGEDQHLHRAPGHRHRQARRGRRDAQEGRPGAHRERGLPQHLRRSARPRPTRSSSPRTSRPSSSAASPSAAP